MPMCSRPSISSRRPSIGAKCMCGSPRHSVPHPDTADVTRQFFQRRKVEMYQKDMYSNFVRTSMIVLAAILLSLATYAQQPAGPEPIACDDAMRAEIVDSITTALNDYYVFPDVAKEMEQYVRKNLNQGKYKDYATVAAFTEALTNDLREICHDRHLRVGVMSPQEVARYSQAEPTEAEKQKHRQEMRERMARDNYKFKKLEIMPGNVGYLKFNQFVDASLAGPTAVAAMNFLANCDALIVDLRENGGGSPSLIQLITSYFFDEPVHLNSFYIRETDSIKQFWTASHVDGPRLSDVDLYVLTSDYTFSGAEEFSYNLKNLERATLVGEATGGGAHPVDGHVFPNVHVKMAVPFGRAINPISGTNWEGAGVTPHIEIDADKALDKAYFEALKKLREDAKDPNQAFALDWTVTGLDAKLNPVSVDPELLATYAGEYGERRLWVEDGSLWYQRGDNPKMKAQPMSETLFWFDEVDFFRLEVVTDMSGNPIRLVGHYDNGHTDESPKSSTDS
ncbi:hypothetical protein GF420_00750 [candidate division GN15 bacterium]|nr:hypothetical protein [candidate division GN15 bacterium]